MPEHRPVRTLAELLVDECPDALVAVTFEGRIRAWNPGAEAMFGYSGDEALGRSIVDLLTAEDQRAEARAQLAEVIRTGFVLTETTRVRKDGSTITVDVSMRRVDDSQVGP